MVILTSRHWPFTGTCRPPPGHAVHVQVGQAVPQLAQVSDLDEVDLFRIYSPFQIWTKMVNFVTILSLSLCTRSNTHFKQGYGPPITTWHTCTSWSDPFRATKTQTYSKMLF
jgi:hypothetical protein